MTLISRFSSYFPKAAIVVSALVMALFIAACEEKQTVPLAERIDTAREARSAGDLRTAILELKNALRDNPDSTAARYLLGQIYIEMESGANAEKELMRARDLGVDAEVVLVPLSRAWILQGKYEVVLDEVRVSVNMPAQTRAALRVVRGDAYYGLGRFGEAEKAYQRALEDDSDNALGHVGLGNVALRRGQVDVAERELARAIALDAADLRVITLKGDVLSAHGKYDEAVDAYAHLVQTRPENVLYRTVLAWSQVNAGKLQASGKNIDRVLSVVPEYPPANHIKAVIAFRNKQYATARDHANQVLAIDQDRLPTLLVLGASSYALGSLEMAYNSLRRYVSGNPNDPTGRKLLSQVQIALGRSDEALETLNPLLGEESEDAELFDLVAQASLLKGDIETGRAYLQRSLAVEPGSPDAMTALGRTRIALGDVDRGLEEIEQAVQLNPDDFGRRMILALEYLRAGRNPEALEAARELQSMKPARAAGYTVEGLVHGVMNEAEAAIGAFRRALEVEPGNPNASLNLVRYAARDEDWSQVKELLDGILARHPGNQKALIGYAELMRQAGKDREARTYLSRAVAANPEARLPTILLAEDFLRTGDFLKGIEVARKILPLYPRNPALLEVIGRLEMGAGQVASAIVNFGNLADIRPDSAVAHFYLALALERQGNALRAERSLATVLEIDPGHVPARFAMTRVLAAQGRLEEADRRLAALARQYPEDADFHETRGVIAALKQNHKIAIASLQKAFALRANSINARRLAEAYAGAGRPDAGQRVLVEWLREHDDDSMTRFTLGGIMLGAGDLPGAEREYRRVLSTEADNAIALNNLAFVVNAQGRGAEAASLIERALELSPESTDILDTAGLIYQGLGRTADAMVAYRKASSLAPRDTDLKRRYAEALIAHGREREAERVLRELLDGPYQLQDRDSVEALYIELTAE